MEKIQLQVQAPKEKIIGEEMTIQVNLPNGSPVKILLNAEIGPGQSVVHEVEVAKSPSLDIGKDAMPQFPGAPSSGSQGCVCGGQECLKTCAMCCIMTWIPLFLIILIPWDDMQTKPYHSPGIYDGRYWSESNPKVKNYPDYIVSNAALFLWGWIIPAIVLGIASAGAYLADKDASNGKFIPYRGWATGIWWGVNGLNMIIMQYIKSYASCLRPIGLARCKIILTKTKQLTNTTFTASIEQLTLCMETRSEKYGNGIDYFRGFVSGHSSIAFVGLMGVGLMLYQVPWILDGCKLYYTLIFFLLCICICVIYI